jgi:hypothetical protein
VTISEHADGFFQCPIKDFTGPGDWEGTRTAYRLSIGWDDQPPVLFERLEQLAVQKDAPKLQALVVGPWFGNDSGNSSADVVKALAGKKDRFAGLRAIFLGDITYDENEISWIQQSDVAPLLKAFPRLEVLRVRGGYGLAFSRVRHEALKQLIVETGGLPRSVIREICRCEFPNLEHLELWLGVENYGWDGGIEDLQPILAGKLFPKLETLGLRNSDIVDEIAAVLVNAPILGQIKILDVSNGTLTDVGAQALLNLAEGTGLRELNLSHHYMTEGMVARLQSTLPFEVIADDGQDPNEEWRSVVVSE